MVKIEEFPWNPLLSIKVHPPAAPLGPRLGWEDADGDGGAPRLQGGRDTGRVAMNNGGFLGKSWEKIMGKSTENVVWKQSQKSWEVRKI